MVNIFAIWGVKHFKVLQDNLIRDEKVLMTFIGLHNYNSVTKHDSNYAYAITNKRITIDTPQEKFNVGLDSGSATAINNAIHEILDNLKTSNKNNHQLAFAPISNAEEIIKYRKLLDAGIITPEEFEAKKKHLYRVLKEY